MQSDAWGYPLTTDSAEAAAAYSETVRGYLGFRADTMSHLQVALKQDPNFALGYAAKGLLLCSIRSLRFYPKIKEALVAAKANAKGLSRREQLYIDALDAAFAGRLTSAVVAYEAILAEYPNDLLAARLAQMELFWLGEAHWMHAVIDRTAPHWQPDMPDYHSFLSLWSFGLEETGQYEAAEQAGRRAVELAPSDHWGTHAVAHTLIMQGRAKEGVAWLDGLKGEWGNANHFVHHLWWHRCLFHLELGQVDAILEIYDQDIRNPDSPLIQSMDDFNVDMQNCASLLQRLELRGIDVGHRWQDLVPAVSHRIGDHTSPFTSPHYVMILAAAGEVAKADDMLLAMRACVHEDEGTLPPRYAAAAIPAAEAAIAHRRGDHEKVLEVLLPARRNLWMMGGSHAQQDVFQQMLFDSAKQVGRSDMLPILLSEVAQDGFEAIDARTLYGEAESQAAPAA